MPLSEAAYITAFLNAPLVASAVAAYASALSLGTSITDYLSLPRFDPDNPLMQELSAVAKALNRERRATTPSEEAQLNRLALRLMEKGRYMAGL